MRGQQAGDPGEHWRHGGGGSGARAHGRAEFAKKQNGRRLAGVIGGLPIPGAVSIGAAKGGFHRSAQQGRVDALAALEMRKEALRGLGNANGRVGAVKRGGKRRSREAGRGSENIGHGGNLWRAGTGRADGRSLSTSPAQTLPGRPLPLGASMKKRVRRRAPNPPMSPLEKTHAHVGGG